MIDYKKRLREVNEILNYLSKDDLLKIPEDIRNLIKENMDNEYNWEYDETVSLEEQDVSIDTIAILSYLNIEYFLNEEQKELMKRIYEENERKLEKEKQEKYNKDDIFENRKNK